MKVTLRGGPQDGLRVNWMEYSPEMDVVYYREDDRPVAWESSDTLLDMSSRVRRARYERRVEGPNVFFRWKPR